MKVFALSVFLLVLNKYFVNCLTKDPNVAGQFLIGAGIYDITGQVVEIGFMGYGAINQKGRGILQRMRSRAFIIGDINKQDNRIVYVSVDNGMGFQIVKSEVIDRLNKTYGNLYNDKNVLISGTHTHSTPGGTGGTVLVDLTTFGFVKKNWEVCVNGIVQSIIRAHENLQFGRIKMNIGDVNDANINRSPVAYLNNPDKDNYSFDTDHQMTLLRFESVDGNHLIGMINFYPVHAVSLNKTNFLVAGDNKGYASYLFEKEYNPQGTLPGQGKFVAAFGQSNLGDVSPNTKGPKCIDTGLPCDFATSTCNGRSQNCIAFGPGNNMYESNQIIGQKQFQVAKNLFDNAQLYFNIGSSINYRHTYVDMQGIKVDSRFTSTGRNETTCEAALGAAFAAGTTDGPGEFDFTQSSNSTNIFWRFVSAFISPSSPQQQQCQSPKPILLNVGTMKPMEWVPRILPHQIFQIGHLYILAIPGEFTTMSGRRLKLTVQQTLQNSGLWTNDSHIVIAGLSNSYSHYVTTFEEYQQQRYEGASTLYGPHTLAAYQQIFHDLTIKLANNEIVPSGPQPYDMRGKTSTFSLPPIPDGVPLGKKFGDLISDVHSSYKPGEIAQCSWWGGNPRNDLFTERSYLYIDQFINQTWIPILTDDDIQTRFIWTRVLIDQSNITVQWNIPINQPVGQHLYRIRHLGVKNNLLGKKEYTGLSSSFTIKN